MIFSRVGLAVLFCANAVPLGGIVFADWNLYTVVMVYWMENLIIGVFTIVKMATASRVGPVGVTKGYKILLYCAHFGTFWVIHGALISFLVFAAYDGEIAWAAPLLGMLAVFLASHGVSLKVNYMDKVEYKKVSTLMLMFVPYGRIVLTHTVLIFGALVALALGEPTAALVALVGLKTALDAVSHVAEHTAIARQWGPLADG